MDFDWCRPKLEQSRGKKVTQRARAGRKEVGLPRGHGLNASYVFGPPKDRPHHIRRQLRIASHHEPRTQDALLNNWCQPLREGKHTPIEKGKPKQTKGFQDFFSTKNMNNDEKLPPRGLQMDDFISCYRPLGAPFGTIGAPVRS